MKYFNIIVLLRFGIKSIVIILFYLKLSPYLNKEVLVKYYIQLFIPCPKEIRLLFTIAC